MPVLSVIVPNYDTAEMSVACCRAATHSLPADAEIVLVDDASTDGTAERVARECPQVRVVRRARNGGYSAAVNSGLDAARGDLVLLLNSDAIVEPSSLAALVAAFDAHPRLGVAGATLFNPDGSPQWSGGRTPTLAWMVGVVSGLGHLAAWVGRRRPMAAPVADVDWVTGAVMAFRRGVWVEVGPFDERFRFYCQDLEFCMRAREAGWRIAVLADVRAVHTLGGTVRGKTGLAHDPTRLWPDLLDWGGRHYGRRWAHVARTVLSGIAWMRIAVGVLRRGGRRDATTLSLVTGARALTGAGRS